MRNMSNGPILLILTNLERASKTLMDHPNIGLTSVYHLRIVSQTVCLCRLRPLRAGPPVHCSGHRVAWIVGLRTVPASVLWEMPIQNMAVAVMS
jgi:hypothetical protein